MAEVLPLPLQSSASITMMHPRPTSADAFQSSSQQYAHAPRLSQPSRSLYGAQPSPTGYRGTAAAPVQPYAFQATPTLRQDSSRTLSAPPSAHGPVGTIRHGHAQSTSGSSTNSSDASSGPSAKDDSVMGSRNGSLINLSSAVPDLSLNTYDMLAKPSPDRYRRPQPKRLGSDGSTTPRGTSPQLTPTAQSSGPGSTSINYSTAPQLPPVLQRQESVDDMGMSRTSAPELPNRYRRRSLNTLDTNAFQMPATLAPRPFSANGPGATSTPTTIRPTSFHERSGSDDSQTSQKKKTGLRQAQSSEASLPHKPDGRSINVPPRAASTDATKRLTNPSPLSRQSNEVDVNTSPPTLHATRPRTYAAAAQAAVKPPPSLAAQHLAAVSDRDLNKGMKSRLRRAFSFGSAQELRRGANENAAAAAATAAAPQQSRQQNDGQARAGGAMDDELDPEQQEIARRQEAAGFGAGIYSGQGGFTGSTDNLSISSTASSASLMLRKMGRGAKKGAKSIKGLFRPKSVIGVPAADGPVSRPANGVATEPSLAQVSMVTVEAERHKVNVNADVSEKHHGITGFPKLERNSLDAATLTIPPPSRGSADGSEANSRRSIVGSDKERAEVLAAVKKGILKRSATASPSASPVVRPHDVVTTDSPTPSMPSTPKDGRSGSMNNSDYFSPRMLSKSMPNTPNGTARNISFSPRIQFHDAWSSTEYDRRGEIATCNRLTPMLAQQIKEELNTFKMEMEVHELSKPHTHFF